MVDQVSDERRCDQCGDWYLSDEMDFSDMYGWCCPQCISDILEEMANEVGEYEDDLYEELSEEFNEYNSAFDDESFEPDGKW